jgi:hypothetical protein
MTHMLRDVVAAEPAERRAGAADRIDTAEMEPIVTCSRVSSRVN